MTPELGYALTVGALVLAVYGAGAAAVSGWKDRPDLRLSSERAAIGVWLLVTACMLLLIYAFLTFDFSVRYVANNTNRGTPFYYRITALWGALEGSIILWAWMLSLYTLIVVGRYRRTQPQLYPWTLAVMLGIASFFLLVMTIPAPPFERLSPVPADGRGLNPLLEDSGMITHPVALYLGFTGFTVPFAFAMAALIVGRTGDEWITITRRWTIIAWYFLSLGLLIGGWWSYHVLGWGGYWAWDPVENAAFMPWLTATAFLHSVMIQERRRMLKLWNLTLIILTFSLTLFGTFLTRSGIIGSVHAFSQGSVGQFFLAFLALVVLGAFSLLAWRLDRLRAQGELDSIVSRESAFLLNNLFLVAAAFTVFFGTVFPLLSEAVKGVKVSVGAPFFNLVNIPIFLALIFLMGVGPAIAWRRASAENLRRNFLKPVLIGTVGAALCWALGVGNTIVLLCFALVLFVATTIALDFARAARARRRTGDGWREATWGLALRQNRRYGGFVVHLGILVIALGVAGSQAWSTQTEATVNRGESLELGGYTIRFDGLQASEESNHFKVTGTFTVSDRRGPYTVLTPAKKFYPQEQTPIAAVDYRLGFLEDLYIVLGEFARDGSHATIKVQINRMVSWLWIGGLVLTLGAALAIAPERRRAPSRPRAGRAGEVERDGGGHEQHQREA
ncbi:MAG: heme lyase CcmF/NrfE family subunit, partial [Candidatus Rokuibacteriota bacterium]